MEAAKRSYDNACEAQGGVGPDGAPMTCWAALSGKERAEWIGKAKAGYIYPSPHRTIEVRVDAPKDGPGPGVTVQLSITGEPTLTWRDARLDLDIRPAAVPGMPDRIRLDVVGRHERSVDAEQDKPAPDAAHVIRELGRTHYVSPAGIVGRTVVHAVEQDKAADTKSPVRWVQP